MTEKLASRLESLVGPWVKYSADPLPLGRSGHIRISYFVDLLSAVHNPATLEALAAIYAEWISATFSLDGCDAIVTPKRGNGLLGVRTAQILGKKSGLAKADILFGQWVEGSVGSGDTVILIDDIASDGELLADTADSLRRGGIFVARAFSLVDRKEGDSEISLERAGIDYSYLTRIDDTGLARLRQQ